MPLPKPTKLFWTLFAIGLIVMASVFYLSKSKVDYNAEVKPILNKHCISCHGGVKKQGGFSLLFRSEALAINKSGKAAIIPGNAAGSEMIKRLNAKDPEERMPYKHPPLDQKEIDLLTAWINQGAEWGNHWAYIPVTAPIVPNNKTGFLGLGGKPDWIANNVDQYIFEQIKANGLSPSPQAEKAILLKRVSMDLIGMPAPQSMAAQYLESKDPAAYEKLVDQLLASPRYGERWAALWMDLARYADTKGYERDDSRNIWRYRDWLIQAFNQNKPYDQFLMEQLAGDLLPNPSAAQYIATAFHRNTMTNDEGGTDNEEFRTAAVIDRVNTTWETLMGTTFSCVQCHSHPYDPFKQEEYYQFLAFFNNTRDEDTYDEYPTYREFHNKDSLQFLSLGKWLNQYAPQQSGALQLFLKTGQPAINSIQADQLTNAALADTKWLVLRNHAKARLPHVDLTGKSEILFRYTSGKPGGIWEIRVDQANGPVIGRLQVPATKNGWNLGTMPILATKGVHDLYFKYQNPSLSTAEESGMQFDWFYLTNPFPGKGLPGYDSAYAQFKNLIHAKEVTKTPVMIENPANMQRPTQVFVRGNWLVKGKAVSPGVPASLGKLPAGAPNNRLGMAKWMTDPQNPLVARTMVNRIWEQFFGAGIVETLEDMGTQGIAPTHRELLDYLAWKFMHDDAWNLKKLMKEIVMSATYQQSSNQNQESSRKDPYNKLYARGPRVRLSAEQIRDQALAVSGLLSDKMYGPGVMPYQPEGIWNSPWNGAYWKKSDSVDQYRRSLYTYWKRSAPYPSMISFDGATREVCTARRIRTNTPLQALNTLNDSVFVEAAQHFAFKVQQSYPNNGKLQISKAYELAMNRPMKPATGLAFEKLYATAFNQFKQDSLAMKAMTGPIPAHQEPATAALIVVAQAIMNTDEFITKN